MSRSIRPGFARRFWSALTDRRSSRTIYQTQTTECPVAALAMILEHHGRTVTLEELRVRAGVSRDCASAADLVFAARHYGLQARALRMEPHELDRLSLPFIAHLNFLHFVVVEDLRDGRIWLNDPATGKMDLAPEEFAESFTGVVLDLVPGPAFERGGARTEPRATLARAAAEAGGGLAAVVLCGAAPAITLAGLAAVLGGWTAGALPQARAAALCLALAAAAASGAVLRHAIGAAVSTRLERVWNAELLARVLGQRPHFFVYRLPGDLADALGAAGELAGRMVELVAGAAGAALGAAALAIALAYAAPGAAALVVPLVALQAILCRTLGRCRSRRGQTTLYRARNGLEFHALDRLAMAYTGGRLREAVLDAVAGSAGAITAEHHDREFAVARGVIERAAPLAVALIAWQCAGSVAAAVCAAGLAAAVARLTALDDQVEPFLELCDRASEIQAPPAPVPSVAPPGRGASLVAVDVRFGYSSRKPPIVDGISLEVPRGARIGLTGPSGGGKSTLAALLAGYLEPDSGRVELGGASLGALDRSFRSRTIAMVSRGTPLFAGTVRANVALGDAAVTDGAVVAALEVVELESLFRDRGGLDAAIEPHGWNVSGGQRQRLVLARALVRGPEYLILDEALDGLEPELESRILRRLKEAGITVLVVTHRTSTLAACDQAHVLRQGALCPPGASPRQAPRARMPAQGPFHVPDEAPRPATDRLPHGPGLATAFARAWAASGGSPTPDSVDDGPDSGLDELERRHGVLARAVRLPLDALENDPGPLVATAATNGAPCAVLPPTFGVPSIPGGGSEGLERTAVQLHADPFDDTRNFEGIVAGSLAGSGLDAAIFVAATWASAALGLAALAALGRHPAGAALGASVALVLVARVLLDGVRELGRSRAVDRARHELAVSAWGRVLRAAPWQVERLGRRSIIRRIAALREVHGAWIEGGLAALAGGGALALHAAAVAVLAPAAIPALAMLVALAALVEIAAARAAAPIRGRYESARLAAGSTLADLLEGLASLWCLEAERRIGASWLTAREAARAALERLRRRELAPQLCETAAPGLAVALLVARAPAPDPMALAATLAGLPFALELAAALARLAGTRTWQEAARPLLALARETSGARRITLAGHLEASALRYTFPGAARPAVDGAGLSVAPGELVALVGASGSGKSTILRLLVGLLPADGGRIQFDGTDLRELDVVHLRAQLALVSTDDMLPVSTLLYALIGSLPVGMDVAWRALREVAMTEDVQAMPMGIQTIADDQHLSSGQRQRMLIASALVREPRLLILDEATSAIDLERERHILAAVRARGPGCLIATHRTASALAADRVYVVEDGRITEAGPPRSLLAADGPFARLHRAALEREAFLARQNLGVEEVTS